MMQKVTVISHDNEIETVTPYRGSFKQPSHRKYEAIFSLSIDMPTCLTTAPQTAETKSWETVITYKDDVYSGVITGVDGKHVSFDPRM